MLTAYLAKKLTFATPGPRMIDERMHISRHDPLAAGRVGVEPTTRVHGQVSGLLDRLHGEIAGCLDHDGPLSTDPGDNRRLILVIVTAAGLAFHAPATRSASQRLLATALCLPLVAGSVVEVIGFDHPPGAPSHRTRWCRGATSTSDSPCGYGCPVLWLCVETSTPDSAEG